MIRSALIVILALASPLEAGVLAGSMAAGGKLVLKAQEFGQDVSDRALAVLYQRLFALQDQRAAAEVKSETAELDIDAWVQSYQKIDRFMKKETLKEIAADPNHRRYPRATERAKLEIVIEVRKLLRDQDISAITVQKIERDMSEVKRMIREHLESRRNP